MGFVNFIYHKVTEIAHMLFHQRWWSTVMSCWLSLTWHRQNIKRWMMLTGESERGFPFPWGTRHTEESKREEKKLAAHFHLLCTHLEPGTMISYNRLKIYRNQKSVPRLESLVMGRRKLMIFFTCEIGKLDNNNSKMQWSIEEALC